MRNLKRALSLAMASIMILGMMVVGAGAASLDDFSDKDKVVNKEAVSVLTTLNVIAGKDDGSFDPTGIVTRAEMAKMICVVLNGGKDPQLGNLTADYKDTKGHWAEAYIAYCTNLGIVAGTGSGNFEPSATVTGSQAAKMLLVALGYNASVEKYVGASWQINVDVAANQNKLYDKLGVINTSDGLSRDNAAQMVYNALSADLVEYNYVITGTSDNSLTTKPQITSKDLGTLLEKKFGAVRVEGVVVANEIATLKSTSTDTEKDTRGGIIGSALDAGKTSIAISNADAQKEFSGTETFTVSSDLNVLGRSVVLYVKPSTTALKSTVIGSAMISDDNKEVKDYSSDKISTVVNDNNLNITTTTQVAKNYAGQTALSNADYIIPGTPGVEKIIIDNDSDGDVDFVLLNTVELGKVTKYATTDDGSITISRATGSFANDNKKNIVGFENVVRDDAVLTSYIGGKLYVEKAESITGTVEAYKLKNITAADYVGTANGAYTGNLTVDGTQYTVSFAPTYIDSADFFAAKDPADKGIIDSEATFYLDKQGYVIARTEVDEAAYQYAYVWGAEAGGSIATDRVKVTLDDGTTKTYDLDSKSDIDIVKGNANTDTNIGEENMQGLIFAYSLSKSGEIKLMQPKGGAVTQINPEHSKGMTGISFASAGNVVNALTAPTLRDGNTTNGETAQVKSYYANNSTVFFYVTTKNGNVDKVSTYLGRSAAPSVDGKKGDALLALNSKGDVGSAVLTDTSAKEEAGDHMFVYANKYVYSDYVEVGAILNGETVGKDIKVSKYLGSDVNNNTVVDDGLYLFVQLSDGTYELEKAADNSFYETGTVDRVPIRNTIVLDSDKGEYLITNKSVIIDNTTNPNPADGILGGSMNKGDTVYMLVNSNEEVLMAYYVTPDDAGSGGGSSVYAPTMTVSGTTLNVMSYGASIVSSQSIVALVKANMQNVTSARVYRDNATTLVDVTFANGDIYTYDVNPVTMYRVTYNGRDNFLAKAAGSVPNGTLAVTSQTNSKLLKADALTGTITYSAAGVADDKYTLAIGDVLSGTYDIVLKDGYKYTDADTVVTHPGIIALAGGPNEKYVPAKTELTITSTVGQTVTATVGTQSTAVVSDVNTAKYVMPTAEVTFTKGTTPSIGLTVTVAAGTSGTYADGVYTAKNGVDKFNVSVSPKGGQTGTEITVTVAPARPVRDALNLTIAGVGAPDASRTISFNALDATTATKQYTFTLTTTDVTLTIDDNSSLKYTLALPSGVTATVGGIPVASGGLVAEGATVTLANLAGAHYTTDPADDSKFAAKAATLTMPAADTTVYDGYYKVAVTATVTLDGGITNSNSTTISAAIKTGESIYVKADGTVTLTLTTAVGILTGNAGGYTATVAGATLTQDPTDTEVAFNADTPVAATKDITVTFTSISADPTLTVTVANKT